MKYKILFIIFIAFFSASTFSEKIHYCKTIVFDTGVFDTTPIGLTSSLDNCRNYMIPIFYNGIKDYLRIRSNSDDLDELPYVKWNKKENIYEYDKEVFFSSVKHRYGNDIKYKNLFMLKHDTSIYANHENGGAFINASVVFLDENNKPYVVYHELFSYTSELYSLEYSSGFVSVKNKRKMDYIEKVNDLFKTVSVYEYNDFITDNINSYQESLLEMNDYTQEEIESRLEYMSFCASIVVPNSKNKRYVIFTHLDDKDIIIFSYKENGYKYNFSQVNGRVYVIDENKKDYVTNALDNVFKRYSDKGYNSFIYTSNDDIYYIPINNNINRELFYFSVDGMAVKGQIFHPNSQNEKECISAFSKRGYHFKFDQYFPR